MKKETCYAVRKGRVVGIFDTWGEVEPLVKGFKGAEYKKCKMRKEAEKYLEAKGIDVNCVENSDELCVTNLKEQKETSELKDGEIISYVDGSFDDVAGYYGYGVVLVTQQETETFNGRDNYPELVSARNVAGELVGSVFAVCKAIEKGYKRIFLHYDYNGIEKWITGEWKAKSPAAKIYKDRIDLLKGLIDIQFIKVTAHSGVEYNVMADKLARESLGK